MPSRRSQERYLAEQRRLIDEHGWAITAVGSGGCCECEWEGRRPGPGDGDGTPPFAYTIGLTRYHGHPEVIVLHCCVDDAMLVLNTLGALVRDGRVLRPGDLVEVTDWPVALLAVDRPRRWLRVAEQMYRAPGGPPIPALQAVLSDGARRFPWHPEYRGKAQQLLGPTPPAAA